MAQETTLTLMTSMTEAISDAVALRYGAVMAPIEAAHNVVYLQPGSGNLTVKFPVAPTGMAFNAVTDGDIFTAHDAGAMTAVEITPVPYELQVAVNEQAILSNPAGYVSVLADKFSEAAHVLVMGLLTDLYDNGTVSGSTGADLTAATFATTLGVLRGKGVGGQINAVLHPAAYTQLMSGIGNIAQYGSIGAAAVGGAPSVNLFGANVFMDSSVGNDGNDYENFIGAKTAIGVALGTPTGLKFLQLDASHIVVAMSVLVGVSVVSATEYLWLKSDYEG